MKSYFIFDNFMKIISWKPFLTSFRKWNPLTNSGFSWRGIHETLCRFPWILNFQVFLLPLIKFRATFSKTIRILWNIHAIIIYQRKEYPLTQPEKRLRINGLICCTKLLERKHTNVIKKNWCTQQDSKLFDLWWNRLSHIRNCYLKDIHMLWRKTDVRKKTPNSSTFDEILYLIYEIVIEKT